MIKENSGWCFPNLSTGYMLPGFALCPGVEQETKHLLAAHNTQVGGNSNPYRHSEPQKLHRLLCCRVGSRGAIIISKSHRYEGKMWGYTGLPLSRRVVKEFIAEGSFWRAETRTGVYSVEFSFSVFKIYIDKPQTGVKYLQIQYLIKVYRT